MSIIAQLGTDKNIQTTYGVSNKFSVPLFEEVDPAIKEQPEYCKNMAQVGFSQLMRNKNSLPVFAYDYIQTLRNYGTGNQPEELYINKFTDTNTKNANTIISDVDGDWTQSREANRQGFQNLDTKIVSVATNLKNAIHGIFSQYDEDLYVNCIDSDSAKEEDMRMYGALFDSKMGDFTDMMEKTFGIPLNPNPKLPKGVTPDEILLYKEMGGFKSAYAVAAEEIVKYGFLVSDWEDTIKRKWIDDLIDLNLIVGRCKYDPEKDIEVVEYVDPANFTIQYSQENNFNDSEYCGYFTLERISKLDVLGFPREKLLRAARRWEHYWSNPRNIDWEHVIYNDKIGNFQVPVYHYNWIDVDVKRKVKATNKYGRSYIYEIPFDKELKPLSEYRIKQGEVQEEMNTRLRRTYECSWVVDTDMVYDYGRSKNQPRKNKRTPMLNFFVWKGITTNQEQLFGSVTESVMPFFDNLQLSWLKYQDALRKSHPGGYAINIRLLQNLQIDGKDISPFQAFEMFWKTGKFPYLDVAMGENYKGGDVLPIRKIEGNLGELLTLISQEIHINLQMIERFTGINPAPLGQTPDKDTPVSSTNMAVIGTNNVLRTFINGMYKVKERLGDCMLRRAQLQIRNNPNSAKAYERIIGTFKIDLLKESEFLGVEYGLIPEARPDEAEIRSIMETAKAALTPGRDGNSQINIAQYAFIMEQVRGGGNIKKLTRDLAFLIRKNEQDIQRRQQENIKLQAEQQANMKREEAQAEAYQNQQKLQGDLMLTKANTEKEIQIDNNKAKNEAMLKQMEANTEFKKMLYQVRNELLKNAERR
jgi:hypothetical protein